MRARTLARGVAVTLMGVAVLVATADGFAQSYAGLYGWAIEHGLSGWKADSFPLLVDTFVGVGELGLFLLAIDGHRLGRSAMSWLDLLVPAAVAASGWGASLVFNVGHVGAEGFATQATAAVPPLASMIGLLVLLRTLHRYVRQAEGRGEFHHVALDVDQAPTAEIPQLNRTAEAEPFPETPPALLAWHQGRESTENAPGTPFLPAGAPFPAEPASGAETGPDDPAVAEARERFADALGSGSVPSVRALMRALRIGHPRAARVRAELEAEART